MAREEYIAQVSLLVRALPWIAEENTFALKGGTAINMFYRNMPRLSVDIDLTYLPTTPWDEALTGIDTSLGRILAAIQEKLPGVRAQRISGGGARDTRIQLSQGKARIKIETSPSGRGTVHAPTRMIVSERVEEEFGFAEMPILAFEDLYAGKLVAALDRQHPRDLFDVKTLYEHEGLTDELFRTFLAYLAISGRPPHELIKPNLKNIADAFAKEFEGMTTEAVSVAELEEARGRLLTDVRARLDESARRFLLTLHDGEPDFDAIGLPQAAALPGVQWKVDNLRKLRTDNADKHASQRRLLEEAF